MCICLLKDVFAAAVIHHLLRLIETFHHLMEAHQDKVGLALTEGEACGIGR